MADTNCEYCGPVCYRGAEHNARVEDNARFAEAVPAVPAQVEPLCVHCGKVEGLHSKYGQQCPMKPQTITQFQPVERDAMAEQVAQPVNGFIQCPTCGFDYRLNVQHDCPVPKPQAGAQDDGEYELFLKTAAPSELVQRIRNIEKHLNTIRDYVLAAQQTPITRETILAAPQVDNAPIPDDLKGDYERACMQHKGHRGYVQGLIERIARLEAENRARKLIALTLCDEAHGLYNLVLSETK
jgi:hypothetical protein